MVLLKNRLEAMGYRVVLTDISWRRKTLSRFAKEFEKFYLANKTTHNIIIGNSFGAVVALLASPVLMPDKLYLCSLSAFFKEDRSERLDSDDIRRFGIQRMQDLWSLSFSETAEKYSHLGLDITVIYGEKEKVMHPLLVKRCQQAVAALSGARLIELPGASHSMGDHMYIEGMLKYIPDLA